MSDEGEMTCPLCAEEMDLTDQQLKPCKCGYEICVWCWHHIMEMAGKQDAEGRCPACRTAYDKDRIVGMSSNCERLVAESNGERKTRSQKARAKATVEARKHLGSVRVIQRNLVYIIGLPLSLFHGNVLERREYFGQYGKVLKVSMSRPSTGSQVAPSSNTFNVYITYAKEEEAVRCIQAVHNFVLDGKQLRACFGTTKYCHAWLRNMPCNNPDCFYLHDIGCQEDSFTKDEVISAYTRSRVSQTITGNSSQQHLGTVLPPPADDFNNAAKPSVKSAIKTSSSDCASVKIPPTCSNLSKSVPLPAAALWCSTLSSSASSILCSRSIKQKQENSVGQPTAISCKKPLTFPKNLLEKGKSFRKDEMGPMDVNIKVSCSSKESIDADSRSNAHLSSDLDYLRHTSAWHDGDALPSARIPERSLLVNSDERSLSLEGSTLCAARDPPKISSTSSLKLTFDENVLSSWDDDDSDDRFILPKTIEGTQAVFLNDTNAAVECSGSSFMKDYESNLSNSSEISTGQTSNSVNATCSAAYTIEKKGILILESQKDKSFHCSRESGLLETDTGNVDIHNDGPNKEVHELSDDMKMLKFNSKCGTHINSMYDQEGLSSVGSLPAGMPKLDSGLQDRRGTSFFTRARSSLVAEACFSRERSDLITEQYKQLNENTLEQCPETPVLAAGIMGCSNLDVANQTVPLPLSTQPVNFQSNHQFFYDGGHKNTGLSTMPETVRTNTGLSTMPETVRTNVSGLLIPCTDFAQQNAGSSDHEFIVKATSKFSMVGKEEMQESSIISNILSMDVNPWDVSSPSDFIKLLCEADKQTDGVKLSNLLKGQNNKGNNQSRFSFARLEGHSVDSFSNENGMLTRNTGYLDHELPTRGLDGSNCQTPNGCSLFSSENNSALQRSKASARIYAPPGFLSSSRAPPPGFSSPNRLSITHESSTVAAYETPGSNISRSQNQVALPGNTEDLDFIDPAILAVGKGSLPFEIHGDVVARPFPAYSNSYNVNRGDLLLQQQSITSLQDHIVSGFIGNMYLPSKDANLPPHFVAQNNGTVPYFPESTAFLNVHMSKNHWNAQNDAQSLTNVHSRNDFVTLNSLRNELFVRNKYFPGSEEHDFLSKKAFGM